MRAEPNESPRSAFSEASPAGIPDAGRIARLSALVADRIAAGEVVERPASVVKELVENAVDAGAGFVEVVLERGGLDRVLVRDDGRGIHTDDLELALARHATSKLREADDLVDVTTLGFRGEALASIAAVATVRLRSRQPGVEVGVELTRGPGGRGDLRPVGLPVGTQVEVTGLFATVPARKKFMRSEAAEAAKCSDVVLRLALVHPDVSFRLLHGARETLSFRASDLETRVREVLGRRAAGPFHAVSEVASDGTRLHAWLAPPSQGVRGTGGASFVVRRRVIVERSLAQILREAYGNELPSGVHPVACVVLDPPRGEVDVNVHPQKSEVRFAEPQRLYAFVRNALARGLERAPWRIASTETPFATSGAPSGGTVLAERVSQALESSWGSRGVEPSVTGPAYRLATRALDADYSHHKAAVRTHAAELASLSARAGTAAGRPELSPPPRMPGVDDRVRATAADDDPEVLAVFARGPIAICRHQEELWVVDLAGLRSHMLRERLLSDLGAPSGRVASQRLLIAGVISRSNADVELCRRAEDRLLELGLEATAFGEDAIVVKAIPAVLGAGLDASALGQLLDRLLPWLRLRERDEVAATEAIAAIASTGASADLGKLGAPSVGDAGGDDKARYRLARAWIAEFVRAHGSLPEVPFIRRCLPHELLLGGPWAGRPA